MTIAIGQVIGIGERNSDKVTLYCEVTKAAGDWLDFFVINGAWYGGLNTKEGLIRIGVGKQAEIKPTTNVILYSGFIPEGQRDYNDAIVFMEQRLKLNPVLAWLYDVSYKVKELKARFIFACTAFSKAWKGEEDLGDDIPF